MHTTTLANQQHTAKASRGFTLIELMIVVVVVGILAAVAIPQYRHYVENTRRGAAQVALMDAAQFMQRFYAANNNYAVALNGTPAALPVSLTTIPADTAGNARNYTVQLVTTPTGFTLSATPVPGSAMANDRCGVMRLTQTGARSVSSDILANCWR